MEKVQLDIFEGRAARDSGIAEALEHANIVSPDWSNEAYKLLHRFLKIHAGPFMGEDVRSYAAQIDFPLPPHARAWGGIIARAAKANLIKRVGTGQVKNAKAHCANAAIWEQVKK